MTIECRRHTKSRQSQEQVAGLAFRVIETGASGGIYVSPLGFQEGAKKVAATQGIHEVLMEPAVLLARGFPGEAAALLRSILTVFERTYGPEHHEVAVVLHNLGTASHAAGQPGTAAELLTRSLAIKHRVLGPDHPELAATLCNLGFIQHEAGDTATAMDYYVRAGRILRTTVRADHPTLRICQDALAALAAAEDGPALPDGHLGDRDKAR